MDVTALMLNALVLLLPACVQNGVSDKTAATFPRIVPSKLQLFEHTGLNVTCEGFFNHLTKWRVMRSVKTGKKTSCNKSFPNFGACHIPASYSSDSGEYWCETEDENRSEKVTITVTAGQVILESPVRPVTVGDTVVLRCIGKNNLHHRADFYKDGRHVSASSTGEMTIHIVSVSDSGRYSCNISKDERSAESVLRVTHIENTSKGASVTGVTVDGVAVPCVILVCFAAAWLYQRRQKNQRQNMETTEMVQVGPATEPALSPDDTSDDSATYSVVGPYTRPAPAVIPENPYATVDKCSWS